MELIIDNLKKRILELESRVSELESMNENLCRILREKSNSERNLSPKKKHSGYVVLFSQEWNHIYTEEVPDIGYEGHTKEWLVKYNHSTKERREKKVWKTLLQTPYSTTIEYAMFQSLVEADFWKKRVQRNLGLFDISDPEKLGEYQIFKDADGSLVNGIFDFNTRANYLSGFWEVELLSTGPVFVAKTFRK